MYHRELRLVLCDDQEGWGGEEGREAQEEEDICIIIADWSCCTVETNTNCKN